MRIASFNVQNLFDRAKALNMGSWTAGRPILEAYAEVNALFQAEVYDAATKRRILELLDELGLLRVRHGDVRRPARRQGPPAAPAHGAARSRSSPTGGRPGSAGSS